MKNRLKEKTEYIIRGIMNKLTSKNQFVMPKSKLNNDDIKLLNRIDLTSGIRSDFIIKVSGGNTLLMEKIVLLKCIALFDGLIIPYEFKQAHSLAYNQLMFDLLQFYKKNNFLLEYQETIPLIALL